VHCSMTRSIDDVDRKARQLYTRCLGKFHLRISKQTSRRSMSGTSETLVWRSGEHRASRYAPNCSPHWLETFPPKCDMNTDPTIDCSLYQRETNDSRSLPTELIPCSGRTTYRHNSHHFRKKSITKDTGPFKFADRTRQRNAHVPGVRHLDPIITSPPGTAYPVNPSSCLAYRL
jgi:hypothetical protein